MNGRAKSSALSPALCTSREASGSEEWSKEGKGREMPWGPGASSRHREGADSVQRVLGSH